MQRVMVVGTSCAGKTTLARGIAGALDVPHVELDVLHWGPGWTECPDDEFRDAVREHAAAERWVIDGNYSKVRDIVLPRATDAVWLNYSFAVVFWRALRRTVGRSLWRKELFGGNRETFRMSFLSRDSILLWVIQTHRRRNREYRALFSGDAGSHVRLTELRTPEEAEGLLRRLGR